MEHNTQAQTPFNPEYEEYVKENPGRGTLKVQVSTANEAFPVAGVTVEIALIYDGDRFLLYKDVTDSSGIVDNIVLPSKPESESQNPETAGDCEATYLVSAYKPGFEEVVDEPIVIHDKTETILPIGLCPVNATEE